MIRQELMPEYTRGPTSLTPTYYPSVKIRCVMCGGHVPINLDLQGDALCRSCIWDHRQVSTPALPAPAIADERLNELVESFWSPDNRDLRGDYHRGDNPAALRRTNR